MPDCNESAAAASMRCLATTQWT